jgi:flavin-dependent dehydrogenase
MQEFDVVMIGAGLAGLHCAQRLGARGLKVLLVDRKKRLSESVHTTGIFVRKTLEEFDLPAGCLGPPIRHVSLYSPKLKRIDFESPHREFQVGRMGALYEQYLSRCRNAGVRWQSNTRFVGLESGSDSSDSVVVLERSGLRYTIKARFVIGADGARSRVARELGLDTNRELIVGVEDVLKGVPLIGPPAFHCVVDPVLAPGYIAWAVNDGRECHIGVGGYPAQFDPMKALLNLYTLMSKGILDLTRAVRTERRAGAIPVGGVLPRIANTRGLLIGDAAGAVSPLTAGGLDPCLRLSDYAADVVTAYLESGEPNIISSYSGREFRSRFTKRIWMRSIFRRIQSPMLIEVGFKAMQIPVLNRIAWDVLFGRNSFPDVEPQERGASKPRRLRSARA